MMNDKFETKDDTLRRYAKLLDMSHKENKKLKERNFTLQLSKNEQTVKLEEIRRGLEYIVDDTDKDWVIRRMIEKLIKMI